MKKLLLFFVTLTMLLGCTKSLYKNALNYQKKECMKQAVSMTQFNECESLNNKSYEEYTKEREALLVK